MKLVQVLSYSGHKADESPRFLKLDDSTVPITQIEDRWYSPGETFFRILTPSGDRYLLRHALQNQQAGAAQAALGRKAHSTA